VSPNFRVADDTPGTSGTASIGRLSGGILLTRAPFYGATDAATLLQRFGRRIFSRFLLEAFIIGLSKHS
jgi:hypothetical protein